MFGEIDIKRFLKKSDFVPVFDVRSPKEYNKGHIPGAINFPLFDNEERTLIGTTYKKKGRDAAIEKGFEITTPKLSEWIAKAREFSDQNEFLIHCWRGGLRSKSLAWLFDVSGIQTNILSGGYKSYRRYILDQFNNPLHILVIGGMTGSGKTEVLRALEISGQQVLDLEKIAHHKGSAFGGIGEKDQNTNEQFENNLFKVINKLNKQKTIWIEDESRKIGSNYIPLGIFSQIRESPTICLDLNREMRIERLINDYASYVPDQIVEGIMKISKRLGGLNTKLALEALDNKDFYRVADIVLIYYDKTYTYNLLQRDPKKIHYLKIREFNSAIMANQAIELARTSKLLIE